MADGLYYRDSKIPFQNADMATVTLTSADLILWPGHITATPADYFTLGKKISITAFGKITTAATPGNLTVDIYYGTASATGTIIASSPALTLIASQTNIAWSIEINVQCRGVGASGSGGSLFTWGIIDIAPAVNAAGGALFPASAPAAVNVDTTVASGINLQFKRSGSTVETATVQDLVFEALN